MINKQLSLVSICIPTYNNAIGLSRLLNSILEQDYKNIEVVITDDSDNIEIIGQINFYTSKGLNIRYFKNQEKLGSPENWNFAMNLANGDLIKIMHHDDWFIESKSLSVLVSAFDRNENLNFVFGNSNDIDINELNVINTHDKKHKWFKGLSKKPELIFLQNRVGAPSATLFRNKNIQFDRSLIWYVDSEFYFEYFSLGKYEYVDYSVANIGISSNQITRKCENDLTLIIKELNTIKLKNKNNLDLLVVVNFEILKNVIRLRDQVTLEIKNQLTFTNFMFYAFFALFRIEHKYFSRSKIERMIYLFYSPITRMAINFNLF
jgi:glycosyltransferase involved in cell wall biosynthesis